MCTATSSFILLSGVVFPAFGRSSNSGLDEVAAARAANTLRGYRSDWADFTTWCTTRDLPPLPARPAALSGI
ncbi:hypothetical protein LWC35_28780 [Pseudonocardia kujensis]|uniref:hypothetical protein n=1 Tax=Pseudonocardia kujensis TaxID=1128675 RepID=UPI001E56033C|nr:hypothetical protein [Pseudonocardia kujensis]MCE0766871.1 hypothetical protein [Pseudonocardia kujensis]